MKLVLVESPTKARTLSRFLGGDYRIEATYGHVRDLPQKELGVDVEEGFEPKYVPVKGRGKRVKELKKLARTSKEIVLATDPDREGEAIAWHASELLRSKKTNKPDKTYRIVFHEITKGAIEEALRHPQGINEDLVNSQQARRILDRLVGYKLSPLLWKKIQSGLSAGRVQSVAVRLIVEREREREAFDPEEYWDILVKVKTKKSKSKTADQNAKDRGSEDDKSELAADPALGELIVKLVKVDGEKAEIGSGEQADRAVADLRSAKYRVEGVERKEAKRSPYPPYTTSTLQQAAARLMRWSGKKTMLHAQRLYEQGLITYHRTDSVSLSKQAVAAVRALIESEYGKEYIPGKARGYKTKTKLAQEAHEAIRPTDVTKTVGKLREAENELGKDDLRLYELVWKQFVACQMESAIYDRTKIEVQGKVEGQKSKVKRYLLIARGEIEKFDGWLRVARSSERKDELLPEVEEKEELAFVDLQAEQKFTQPPARYSEATLIKKLEAEGIGRPSTYAPIISTVQDRHYVEKDEGRFIPTKLGITVNDFLVEFFPKILDLKFTARMENRLDEIAQGEREWREVLRKFYEPFSEKLEKVEEEAEKRKVEFEKLDEKCPTCGEGDLIVRIGKYGKFISCSRFPKCKYSRNYVEKAGMECPECGGEIVIKRTRKGKRFYGCGNYPKCEFAAWKKSEIEKHNK